MNAFDSFMIGLGETASFITMAVVIHLSVVVCSYINYKRNKGE